MSWMEQVVKVTKPLPARILVYAPPGVGKSTLGASLPKPILIDFDKGADELKVDKVPGPKTWDAALGLIRAIAADPGDYKSLVIDTLDPLEDLGETLVCDRGGKKSIGDFGYGGGYEALAGEWRVMLAELDQVRAKGLIVCLLAHSIVRQAVDPTLGEYDEYTSQLQKKTWATTLRWADLVGFAAFDAARVEKERRAIVTDQRVFFTQRGSGFQAKNRYGMPPKLPLSWPAIEAAIARHQASPADVILRIEKMSAGTPFADKAKAYVADANLDVSKLLQIEDALQKKLDELVKVNGQPEAKSP